MGCPHLHRSLILSVLIQSLLAKTLCSSICTQVNPTQAQAVDTGSKIHTLLPQNIHDREERFPPDSLHCTWHACMYIPKPGNQCGISNVWGGSILSLQRPISCTVVQRRTNCLAFPCCCDHPTGTGQDCTSCSLPNYLSLFLLSVPSLKIGSNCLHIS